MGNTRIMTKIIGREIKGGVQGATQPSEILLHLICFWEKCSLVADRHRCIIGWSKSELLFWSQQSHIDLHYLMVSAWKFIIVTNTIKLSVCHQQRAFRDGRRESSFLLEQQDYSNGKQACTSLPSGYDATALWGRAVWAVILESRWVAKNQECLAAENVKQERMAKKKRKNKRLVNRTSVWVFYWLYSHGQGTARMDVPVYHRNRKGSRKFSMESVWVAWWRPRLAWKRKVDWGFRLGRNGELTLTHGLFLKVTHHCAHSRAPQIISHQVNKSW